MDAVFTITLTEMEMSIISVDNIKPFSAPNDLQPFKLNRFDQLMPCSYTPLIHFYPNPGHNKSVTAELKASLSKTLDLFYPLSGRVNEANTTVHNFHQGVPFMEARIRGQHLVDFLQPPKLQLLHNLVPLEPLSTGNLTDGPQIAVQLNTFDCGGIALGFSLSHKLIDGGTFSAFLKAWATYLINPDVIYFDHAPDFFSGSSVFPPRQSNESHHKNPNLLKWSTRRFVFDKSAISALRMSTSSAQVEHPSKAEALSAFILKHSMLTAAAAVSGSSKFRNFTLAINMRSLMGRRLSKRSIGNLLYPLTVSCKDKDIPDEKEMVAAIRKGIMRTHDHKEDFFNSISIEQQFAANVTSGDQQQLLACSSWLGFGFSDFEFGLGKPVWTALAGDSNENSDASVRNCLVILKEAGARNSSNNRIEAWITLPHDVMAALEINSDFFKFASPNPSITFN